MPRKIIKPEVIRVNKNCAYFPCHKGLKDCTFCYCPFYPCLNKKLGEYVFSKKRKRNVWSCKDCSWIHKKDLVDKILKLVRSSNINPKKNENK